MRLFVVLLSFVASIFRGDLEPLGVYRLVQKGTGEDGRY